MGKKRVGALEIVVAAISKYVLQFHDDSSTNILDDNGSLSRFILVLHFTSKIFKVDCVFEITFEITF